MEKSKVIVDEMYESDKFSQWLGIEIVEIKQGYCKLKMKVREEMTNGFGIAHGGICFSIADTALAFAANSHNIKSLSIETACLKFSNASLSFPSFLLRSPRL